MRTQDFTKAADHERVGAVEGPIWRALIDEVCAGSSRALATLVTTHDRWLCGNASRSRCELNDVLWAFTVAVYARPNDAVDLQRDTQRILRNELRGRRPAEQRRRPPGQRRERPAPFDPVCTSDPADMVAARLDAAATLTRLAIPPAGRIYAAHLAFGTEATPSQQKNFSRWRNAAATVELIAEITNAA